MSVPPLDQSYSSGPDNQGSVLIVVLVVCLGLVSLALLFGHSMLMAYRGSDDDLAGRQAAQAMEGAAQYAAYLMTNVTNDGDLPDYTTYQSQAVPVGDAFFWFIGVPLPTDPQGTPVFRLVDEASKLNLNHATAAMLENLPGITDDLAEAIYTWQATGGAAASLTGASAGISTGTVKEAPFESAEELAQVDGGIDIETLYGNDTNLNHVLDTWEDTGAGQLNSGLLEYVTAFTREPKVRRDGTSRVDVTQTRSVRGGGGSGANAQPGTTLEFGPGLSAVLTAKLGSSRAQALRRNIYPTSTARAANSVLDFFERSGMTATELGEVSPYLTIGSGTYRTGMVNVNTASQTVLSCVPGITWQLAGQIVAARLQLTAPSSDLSWVGPLLGSALCRQAGPYLTTRSYQVTADVAATGRNGHGYRRTQFVIDSSNVLTASSANSTGTTGTTGTSSSTSGNMAQIVYRRDLGGLGWALGANARQTVLKSGGAQ